jgi:hypothetical protein
MKIILIVLLIVFVFMTGESQAMKIYKYHDSKKPVCANLWTGYNLNFKTHYEIGFGDDSTSPDNPTITELTEQEYIDWAKANGDSEQNATSVLVKLKILAMQPVGACKLTTKKEVLFDASERIKALFTDPNGISSSVDYKIKIMSQMISVLFALNGTIKYTEIGIPSITDKESADKYIADYLLPLWLKGIQIQAEAAQFIIDNALE